MPAFLLAILTWLVAFFATAGEPAPKPAPATPAAVQTVARSASTHELVPDAQAAIRGAFLRQPVQLEESTTIRQAFDAARQARIGFDRAMESEAKCRVIASDQDRAMMIRVIKGRAPIMPAAPRPVLPPTRTS